MSANGYLKSFINARIRRKQVKYQQDQIDRGTSINAECMRTGRTHLGSKSITVTRKWTGTLRSAPFNEKHRVDQRDHPGVAYTIPWLECDKQYVGETGKQSRACLRGCNLALFPLVKVMVGSSLPFLALGNLLFFYVTPNFIVIGHQLEPIRFARSTPLMLDAREKKLDFMKNSLFLHRKKGH